MTLEIEPLQNILIKTRIINYTSSTCQIQFPNQRTYLFPGSLVFHLQMRTLFTYNITWRLSSSSRCTEEKVPWRCCSSIQLYMDPSSSLPTLQGQQGCLLHHNYYNQRFLLDSAPTEIPCGES